MLYHDLLRRVFELMDNQPGEYIKPKQASAAATWASAALVCRQWTFPAQSALYNRVFITIMSNPDRNTRAILFARTMHTAPLVRALLRHFSLTVKGVAKLQTELVDWMCHVPGSLLSLESSLEHREQPAQLVFYSAPAIRGLRELILRGHHPRELLNAIGTFPHLEQLTIQFDDLVKKVDTWIPGVEVTLPPSVRTVRIDACTDRYLAASVALMRRAASAPHLRVIELRIVDPVVHAGGAAIAQALLAATPNLRELRMWSVPWAPQIPFMDELVLRAPALERLECVLGTFSDELFVRLPATVKDLRLALWGAEHFPHEAGVARLLERVGQGGNGMALTELEIFSKSAAVRNQLAGLASACGEHGVTLRWTE